MMETERRVDMSKPRWRPSRAPDLPAIGAIAARIHPDLPERPEVFAEKMRLYPDGCRVLATDDGIVGYRLAHPCIQHRTPPRAALDAGPDSAVRRLARAIARRCGLPLFARHRGAGRLSRRRWARLCVGDRTARARVRDRDARIGVGLRHAAAVGASRLSARHGG